VQNRVIARERETTLAIYREMGGSSNEVTRECRSCCVPDDLVRIGLSGFDRQPCTIVQPDRNSIRRLATPAGLETGAIEGHGVIPDGDDDRVGLEAVIVVEVKSCGGLHRSPNRNLTIRARLRGRGFCQD